MADGAANVRETSLRLLHDIQMAVQSLMKSNLDEIQERLSQQDTADFLVRLRDELRQHFVIIPQQQAGPDAGM